MTNSGSVPFVLEAKCENSGSISAVEVRVRSQDWPDCALWEQKACEASESAQSRGAMSMHEVGKISAGVTFQRPYA
jgi:hypothetical protein